MAERKLYRLKPYVEITDPDLAWLEPGECYEAAWDEEFPLDDGPADFIVYHPTDPNEVARLQRGMFVEVKDEEEC